MSIIDHVKEVAHLAEKYRDQELYSKIVDLRDEIFELREENLQLKEERRLLKEAADITDQLVREGNSYYRANPNGEKAGPYCLTCWDYERKLVSLIERRSTWKGTTTRTTHCGICVARKR